MASSDLEGAVATFLLDNTASSPNTPGDLRTTINNEIASLLTDGCVILSRAGRSGQRQTRRDPAPAAAIELVPVGREQAREVGIGTEERTVLFDVKFTFRMKDAMPGSNQWAMAKNVTRAVIHRYEGVSDLAIAASDELSTFAISRASLASIDEIPDSSELIRAVVRLSFAFLEAMASNE